MKKVISIMFILLICGFFISIKSADEKPHSCFGCFGQKGNCIPYQKGNMVIWIVGERRPIPCPENSPVLGDPPEGYSQSIHYFIPDTPEPITTGRGVINGMMYYTDNPGDLIYCYEPVGCSIYYTYNEWENHLP